MKVQVAIVQAFVEQQQGGNPAGVVLQADYLRTEQKQAVAKAVGYSETAFVSGSAVADFKLEFFTPNRQIAHCGHATIAAFNLLQAKGLVPQPQSSKETIDGIRTIRLQQDQAFMQQLRTTLSQHGVPAEHIKHEQFGFALPPAANIKSSTTEPLLSANFIRAGISTAVTLNSQHSLLQSAEQHNLAPRFGCRMGVCFQCVCDKVSGQVRDIRSGALSGHGAEQIQLCISQPVTELVIKL